MLVDLFNYDRKIKFSKFNNIFISNLKKNILMQNQQNSKTIQITKSNHQQSFRIKIKRPLQPQKCLKTAYTDCTSQVASSRQTMTQSSSRYCTLWEKDFDKYERRRQSQLNSLFRARKQKLESITKENLNLYIRLNSQQSQYSHRQLRSHSKESQDKECLTFRTIDLKESRQILGPIGNFGTITRLKLDKSLQNKVRQKQNIPNSKQSIDINLKHKYDKFFRLSIGKKLGFTEKKQPSQQKPLQRKNRQIMEQRNKNSEVKCPKKSLKLSQLPQIYSFF